MNINSILKVARYHFGYDGWLATDENNSSFWFKDKPTYNKHLGVWVNESDNTLIEYELICEQTELITKEYRKAIFKL